MSLKKLRVSIDSIDSKILKLLNERAKITLRVGDIKSKRNESIYVPERESEVYKKLAQNNNGPLPNTALEAIYREVMSSALRQEKRIKIAYLGPEFTFTHLASMKKFGSSVEYLSCGTITSVFDEVEKTRADYGVVPIENSVEGAVNHTLDMFIDSDLVICSEIYLEISHSLLSRESDKDKIKKVYSKDQVFGQCRLWLEDRLPNVALIEVASTAKAAEVASKEKGSACIASELAAAKYHLKDLYDSIEDNAHNVTRFLVIGRTQAKQTKKDKTSIMFSLKDRVGALHDILMPFKKYRINLTKIESRPSKIKAWKYYFFVDMEGHHLDKRLSSALSILKKNTTYLKILGSYPAAEVI
ncbi:MAG: prephenate dehydratase [Candidatus Omnitrophota bacterium]|nr:prephenate dehydratase [Candidatus Omnitrophota bacterium]